MNEDALLAIVRRVISSVMATLFEAMAAETRLAAKEEKGQAYFQARGAVDALMSIRADVLSAFLALHPDEADRLDYIVEPIKEEDRARLITISQSLISNETYESVGRLLRRAILVIEVSEDR